MPAVSEPTVSVIIPTWQGADIIGDAIGCAVRQTHARLQIIVAVDASTDDTASLAMAAAANDARIEVLAHTQRLGWTRNINTALEKVSGDYFFLYFHDDLLEPDYVETLLGHLSANANAGCAYGAVVLDDGDKETQHAGRASTGAPFNRLMDRFLQQTGAPLRALTRTHLLKAGLRFPETSFWGWQAQLAYLARLMGSGDVLYEPRTLYRRRSWRPGGLTKSWKAIDRQIIMQDAIAILEDVRRTTHRVVHDARERDFVLIAADLRVARAVRMWEMKNKADRPIPLASLTPRLSRVGELPQPYAAYGAALAANISKIEAAAAAQLAGR